MPTGYTASVMDGSITEFDKFALQCARAMGACVTMRDEPWDAPIPEKFEPSDYAAKRLQETKTKLAELLAMSSDEIQAACDQDYAKRVADQQKYRDQEKIENDRLTAMEVAVRKWKPPSSDHVGLKDFMLQQIKISRNDAGWSSSPIEHLTPGVWYKTQVERAFKDVSHYAEEHEKEVKRAADRTLWIKQLRNSLAPTKEHAL